MTGEGRYHAAVRVDQRQPGVLHVWPRFMVDVRWWWKMPAMRNDVCVYIIYIYTHTYGGFVDGGS